MLASLLLAATALSPYFAATPQDAAQRAFASEAVIRTNVAGNAATVLLRNAVIEGQTEPKALLLLERFSFGWQPLALLDYCNFDDGVSVGDRALLMRGMPWPHDSHGRHCLDTPDSGPQEDVDAVRLHMGGPLVPTVVARGNYAIGYWDGAGGGMTLFKKAHGSWVRIAGGGGALGADELESHGVPASDACAFAPWDAHCKR